MRRYFGMPIHHGLYILGLVGVVLSLIFTFVFLGFTSVAAEYENFVDMVDEGGYATGNWTKKDYKTHHKRAVVITSSLGLLCVFQGCLSAAFLVGIADAFPALILCDMAGSLLWAVSCAAFSIYLAILAIRGDNFHISEAVLLILLGCLILPAFFIYNAIAKYYLQAIARLDVRYLARHPSEDRREQESAALR